MKDKKKVFKIKALEGHIEVPGKVFNVPQFPEFSFFVHRRGYRHEGVWVPYKKNWTLSEMNSGLSFCTVSKIADILSEVDRRIKSYGLENIKDIMRANNIGLNN